MITTRRNISSTSGDVREGTFLFQRVSVLLQRYNAVLLHDTLPTTDCTDDLYTILYISIFKFSRERIYRRLKNNNRRESLEVHSSPTVVSIISNSYGARNCSKAY